MSVNKIILLSCGQYNPPTNRHIRMFEVARDYLHSKGDYQVVGGIVSPVHQNFNKKAESSTHRLEMTKIAFETCDWIKVSSWECKQNSWTGIKPVLDYHQNKLDEVLQLGNKQQIDFNSEEYSWIPNEIRNGSEPVDIKLLCNDILLESFSIKGLYADYEMEAMVGQYGLIVITVPDSYYIDYINDSDILSYYTSNITIVTEPIPNDVRSEEIRRALSAGESVQGILPDKVIDYIKENNLYGVKNA